MTYQEIIGITVIFIMFLGFAFISYSTLYPKGYKYHKKLWSEIDNK